jgi:hypothetical protein
MLVVLLFEAMAMAVAWTVVLAHWMHTATAKERLVAICVVLLLARLWLPDPAVTLARSDSVIFAGWARTIDDAVQSAAAASIARIMGLLPYRGLDP